MDFYSLFASPGIRRIHLPLHDVAHNDGPIRILHTISFHPAIRLPNPDRLQAPIARYQQNGFILRLESSTLVLDAAAFPFLNAHAPGDDVAVVADAVRMAQFRLIHKPGAQRLVLVLGL